MYRTATRFAIVACASLLAMNGYAQTVFNIDSTRFSLDENSNDLANLNAHLTTRVSLATDVGFELDEAGKSKFTLTTPETLTDLAFKPNESFNHELTSSFSFTIIARNSTTNVEADSLRVILTINDVDERPEAQTQYTGTHGRVFYIQKSPDIGFIPQIFAHQVFDDPDRTGGAMRFKPCADDFHVAGVPYAQGKSTVQSTTQEVT